MGTPEHLIVLIRNLNVDNSSYVRVGDLISEEFKIGRGTRQGCILYPTLFNIYGEWIIRKATKGYGEGVLIGARLVSNLRYADDTVLLARSEQDMANLLLRIEMISGELLMIDRTHTSKENSAISWDVGVVDTYLGVLITNKGGSGGEVRRRMAMGKATMGRLTKLWKDHSITTRAKDRQARALVFSVATYASVLNYNIIDREENRCVRDVLLAKNASYTLDKYRLLRHVQRNCLRYFGHIARRRGMEYIILTGKTSERHIPGHPPTRFVDQLKKLTGLKVAEMVHRAQDRDGCRRIMFGIQHHLGNQLSNTSLLKFIPKRRRRKCAGIKVKMAYTLVMMAQDDGIVKDLLNGRLSLSQD
ncbi:hypothetical protein LAZ67_6003964 [Cordylochernes scorpioides]|uniref:Reverse transcriptase domain-containing protein n=1 Tax=Cordylochernes scorpioides TaxID=51811 RepID=A0ABY6KNZ8_9ARAC|nr:hypothetical protein LAZ67_6003964 [Cordylochernes scorpioides]